MTAVRTLSTAEIDSVAGAGRHSSLLPSINVSPVINVLGNNNSDGGVVAFANFASIIVGGNNRLKLGGLFPTAL
jgi:hypothetical protein